jgi:hypothetical protein
MNHHDTKPEATKTYSQADEHAQGASTDNRKREAPDGDQQNTCSTLRIRVGNWWWRHVTRRLSAERLTALFTFGILSVTAFYTYYARHQAVAAVESANAAKSAADTAAQAFLDGQTSSAITLGHMKTQADAAKTEADAAKIQADAAQSIVSAAQGANELTSRGTGQSLEIARLEQRAWLSIQPCYMDKEFGAYPAGPTGILRGKYTSEETQATAATIKCQVINTGHSPALAVRDSAQWAIGRPPIKLSDPFPPEIVFPGSANMAIVLVRMILTDADNSAYRKGSDLFILARSDYRDVAGRPHWTQACYRHHFNDGVGEFSYCGASSDDQEGKGLLSQQERQP